MSYVSDLSPNQRRNALGIIAAVQARGWPQKAAVIAIETALTESGMRMIASANVPASRRYPHDLLSWTTDGLGHDHASMGMFQQQTGYRWAPANHGHPVAPGQATMQQSTMSSPDGWGTPDELMDAGRSTAKFLEALARLDWRDETNWAAAQAVQHSAFGDGSSYRAQDARAAAIVAALWSTTITDMSEEDEMLIVRDAGVHNGGHGLPVLITGATHTVITDPDTAKTLIAVGAKQVTLPHEDYIRIRKGAVK